MNPVRFALSDIARRQHGVITLRQAMDLGVSRRFVQRRLESGEWRRISIGVFAVAGSPDTAHQRHVAAVLSRPDSFVSGRSAAWMLDIGGTQCQQLPEITVPYSASARSSIAKVHRSFHHRAIRTTTVGGIPCAAPPETVFRMSEYVGSVRLARMVDELLLSDAASAEELGDIYLRHQGERMRGMAKLRPILLERLEGAFVPTESELEALADAVFGTESMPTMLRQQPMPWAPKAGRFDRMVPEWRLIIELDGRTWHARTAAFENDRERDNAALRNGYRTVRLTWQMLKERPGYCRNLIMDVGRQFDAQLERA
ncbi:MAG: hypothetical protein HKN07_01970 [Acidimicrobiia bacterium]|nr:hypothetical protein [Acidimicrobiia bacterium]